VSRSPTPQMLSCYSSDFHRVAHRQGGWLSTGLLSCALPFEFCFPLRPNSTRWADVSVSDLLLPACLPACLHTQSDSSPSSCCSDSLSIDSCSSENLCTAAFLARSKDQNSSHNGATHCRLAWSKVASTALLLLINIPFWAIYGSLAHRNGLIN
jgi:hypothetical protein